MPDATIPRHSRGRPSWVTYGRFVTTDKKAIVLVDRSGNVYQLPYVNIVQGMWGRREDGVTKLPRPWVYAGDEVLIEGDIVVILFMDGNPHRPIVIGASRSFEPSETGFEMPENHDADGADWSVLLGRLRNLEPNSGVELGDVRWNIHGDGASRVGVELGPAGYAELRHVVPLGGTEWVPKGDALLTDLSAAFTEIIAAFSALGVPLPNTQTLVTNIATSLGAGMPYLSRTLKTE